MQQPAVAAGWIAPPRPRRRRTVALADLVAQVAAAVVGAGLLALGVVLGSMLDDPRPMQVPTVSPPAGPTSAPPLPVPAPPARA